MEFLKVVKERTAIRSFSDKKVNKEVLFKILEVGRLAPTAKNRQPFKIYVVDTKENLLKIDKATPCRYNAKTVLIVCGNKDEAFIKDDVSTYSIDSSIVATHLMLGATNYGIDNIWIEVFNTDILKEELNIPANLEPVCLIPLGYKDINCPKNPMHKVRKPLEEIVIYK